MTFEEFFKKKKINLQLLQEAEPALFSEFKLHYAQMGEKSFDHTKKYWFNQLRRKFPTPPEVKAEKVVIENQLAEQTIADTLTEPTAPNVGFKPRFKAGMAAKPATEQPIVPEEKPAVNDTLAPALGFKPKFRTAAAKPAEEASEAKTEIPAEEPKPAPALGFKPKFKAAAPPQPTPGSAATEPEEPAEEEKLTPALGFKPKFRAASPPKPVTETEATTEAKDKKEVPDNEPLAEPAPKPMGFKPRFNAKNIKPEEE